MTKPKKQAKRRRGQSASKVMLDCNKWLEGTHKHCKKCGSEMQFLTRSFWIVNGGVRAIGICHKCKLILVERENSLFIFPRFGLSKWLSAT